MSLTKAGPVIIVMLLSICLLVGRAGGSDVMNEQNLPSPSRSFQLVSGDNWSGNAVCYGPHRDGQRPGGPKPTVPQIREDLRIISSEWNLVRLYGSSEFAEMVLGVIRSDGLDIKVMLGIWIAPEEKRDEKGVVLERYPDKVSDNQIEIDAGISLAARFPEIVLTVCVGNETQVSWSPHPGPLDILIKHVRKVRSAVTVPVTAADDYQYWLEPESKLLAREIDFITMHAHPLWNGRQLDEALSWLQEQLTAVQNNHPDHLVVIGETGWATDVASEGEQARLIKGKTGESEQAVFYKAASAWASSGEVISFIFEAFDENWKGGDNPHEVEKHWGLFRADRTPKAAIGK